MPTLNPNKAYSYAPPPPLDLEEKALPENWLEQLGNSASTALQLSEDDKVRFLADLQRHAGVDATYSLKPQLQASLKAICSKLLSPDLSPDQKMSLALKLHEDATECTAGFHNRVNIIVSGFLRPKNFAALVQNFRQEIVGQIASQNTNEVHTHNLFFEVAYSEGYGVTPINPGDVYPGEISDEDIKRLLREEFFNRFLFFALLNALQSYLMGFLLEDGYTGKKATGEYSSGEYLKFSETLKSFVSIEAQDLYVMNDEYQVIDINWPKVKAALLKKLIEENYFHLTPEEKQELRLFNLDDVNAEEPLEEKESSPSHLCDDYYELQGCLIYFKDWPHQGSLVQLIQNYCAGELLAFKKEIIKEIINDLETIPELKDQLFIQQYHVNLAAEEGDSQEVLQKIKTWARIGCDLNPVFPLLLNTIKGRQLLSEDENIQRLFPEAGIEGKSLDEWLQQEKRGEAPFIDQKEDTNKMISQCLDKKSLANLARTSKTMASLFARSLKQRELLSLLEHIVKGEPDKALDMIKSNPSLLLEKGTARDYAGYTFKNRTPLQAALCCQDLQIVEDIQRCLIDYAGIDEAARQWHEQFPKGWEAEEKEAWEPIFEQLETLTQAIQDAAPGDIVSSGCPHYQLIVRERSRVADELIEFRRLLDSRRDEILTTGRQFNPQLLLRAYEIYDNEHRIFRGHDDSRRLLFWRRVIGYIQRSLPANGIQAFCDGLFNTRGKLKNGVDVSRSWETEIFNYVTQSVLPISLHPLSSRLGLDFALYSVGPAVRVRSTLWRDFESYVNLKQHAMRSLCTNPPLFKPNNS